MQERPRCTCPISHPREQNMPVRFDRRVSLSLIPVIAMILLIPSMVTWAVKPQAKPSLDDTGDWGRKDLDKAALSYFQRTAIPDQDRALGLSPLGGFTPYNPP